MPQEPKKSGLHKDVSSIFAGLEEVSNGRAAPKPEPPPEAPAPEKEPTPPPAPVKAVAEVTAVSGTFPRRRNAWIGLDIGQSSIKMVQIYPAGSGWEIGGYAVKEARLELDGEGLEKKEALLRHLKELISQARGANQGAVCSLRGDGISTGLIPLARMPKKELDQACRLEAKRRVPFNVEKAFIQSHPVPEETARPGGKLNYIVTIARRESVARRLAILQEAGFQVAALLPLPFAWKNLLGILSGGDQRQVRAEVDIGSDRTLVCVYQGAELQFSREFDVGGDQVTEAIIQAGLSFGEKVEISWQDAERLKKGKNILKPAGNETLKGSLSISHVASMVRPVLERIVQEAKRSLEYYSQLYRGVEVSRVFLSGGGSLLQSLVPFFQERMRAPVEMMPLPSGISTHPSIESREELAALFPCLCRALALSLSRKWEVNFIPPVERVLQAMLRSKAVILILLVFLFGMSFLFYRSKAALIPQWQKQVEAQQRQLVVPELEAYDRLEEVKKQLAAREKQGQYSSIRQPKWNGLLKELGRITPRNIIITHIYLIEGTVPLQMACEGKVVLQEASLHSTVTDFIGQVEGSPFFREVAAISEDVVQGTFHFNCILVY